MKNNKFFTIQNIIILILLLSYLGIFYAYKYDIDQIKDIINNYQEIFRDPEELCSIYYNYSKSQQSSDNITEQNISEIVINLLISKQDGK